MLFYDADDRVTRVEWSQGLAAGGRAAQVYHYDELSRLVNFEQGPWSGAGFSGALSSEHHWTLDEQGNWSRHRDETSGGVEWQPPVDAVNAYQSWPTRVDYDRDGTIAPSETNHPLSLAYDAARGFLHERETSQGRFTIYRHDALGRLSQVAQRIDGVESEVVRYGYSADGRLAYRKQASPAEELYLVSDGDQVVIERTASAVQRTYVWAGATLLKTRALGGLELHLHQDRLGSVVLATQAGGSGAELHRRVQFDPYGRRASSGAWEGPGSWDRYGYAGARWDAAVGLYLMGARWYAPELGRFLELDPIGEGGGWNLYNYVGSSPTMWVDPTGLYREGRETGKSAVQQAADRARSEWSTARKNGLLGPRAYSQGIHSGMKVYIDGINTNDMVTGNQMYSLNYSSSVGGSSSGSTKAKKGDASNSNQENSVDQNTEGVGDSSADQSARDESTNGSAGPASDAGATVPTGGGDTTAADDDDAAQPEPARPESARAVGRSVEVTYTDGSVEVRSEGTRSWRNNNPGNLRDTPFSRRHGGAIGNAGGFAVFPDEEAGESALVGLLGTRTYQRLSVAEAIERFAPRVENDTERYRDFIERRTGLGSDTRMDTLSADQIRSVGSAIRHFEGWRVGEVTWQDP